MQVLKIPSDAVRQKLSAKLLPTKKKVPEAKLVYKQRILTLSAAIPGGLGVEWRAHNSKVGGSSLTRSNTILCHNVFIKMLSAPSVVHFMNLTFLSLKILW